LEETEPKEKKHQKKQIAATTQAHPRACPEEDSDGAGQWAT